MPQYVGGVLCVVLFHMAAVVLQQNDGPFGTGNYLWPYRQNRPLGGRVFQDAQVEPRGTLPGLSYNRKGELFRLARTMVPSVGGTEAGIEVAVSRKTLPFIYTGVPQG